MPLPYRPMRPPVPGAVGAPNAAGTPAPQVPRPAAPQRPTVPVAPIGRPPGQAPSAFAAPGSYPARMEAALPQGNRPWTQGGLASGVPGRTMAQSPIAPGAVNPNATPYNTATASQAPQQQQPQPSTAPPTPAPQAAPVGLPPSGPTAAPQPGAPPIATPPTAASQPLSGSPWAYEQMWGALGDLGDSELEQALKGAAMGGLKGNAFGDAALARAQGLEFERGMGGLRGAKESAMADLARRGITGPAAAAILAEQESAARSDISRGQREIAGEYEGKREESRRAGIEQARAVQQDLVSKGVNLENLRMNREQLAQQIRQQQAAMAAAGRAGEPFMLTIDNGDGTTSQIDSRMLELVLGLGEGGRE